MNDYLLLMHDDAPDRQSSTDGDIWDAYFAKLSQTGCLQGGSSIGEGLCLSKSNSVPDITRHLSGYIKIQANSLSHAQELVIGNPVFEAGGTVEIRELPKD